MDLEEYEGRLYLTPMRGGTRAELRVRRTRVCRHRPSATELVVDDRLAYGTAFTRWATGGSSSARDTLVAASRRRGRMPMAGGRSRQRRPAQFASLIGEYGWDHDVLYIREKDGKLNALIEWFFEYPLERVSRDVYRVPATVDCTTARRSSSGAAPTGRATVAVAATVPFKRRPLPADDDRVNFQHHAGERRRRASRAKRSPRSRRRRRATSADRISSSSRRSTRRIKLRHPLRDVEQLHGHAVLHVGARLHAAAGGGGGRARVGASCSKLGYGLLIHDSYRPWYVTKMFWDGTPRGQAPVRRRSRRRARATTAAAPSTSRSTT